MRSPLIALLAIAPALALAAPRTKKKPPRAKPASTKPVEGSAEPTPTPEPAPEDATKPGAAASAPAKPDPRSASPAPPPPSGAGNDSKSDAKPAKLEPVKVEPAAEAGPDVDTLRQEYLALRDELFRSRARASTVASALYSTRVQIKLTYTTGRYYNPAKASIRLDGASVYEDATGAIASDDGIRFEGFVAPGRHVITFRVEAAGKDDDSFTSTTESQIVVKAVANKDLLVAAKAKDAGDIAYAWKRSEHGSYGLGLDVAVKTAARAAGAKP
jgi:hypothetical protein